MLVSNKGISKRNWSKPTASIVDAMRIKNLILASACSKYDYEWLPCSGFAR